jgi:hypothetical protein
MRNAFWLPTVFSASIGFGAQVKGRAIARSAEDDKKFGDVPLLEFSNSSLSVNQP